MTVIEDPKVYLQKEKSYTSRVYPILFLVFDEPNFLIHKKHKPFYHKPIFLLGRLNICHFHYRV